MNHGGGSGGLAARTSIPGPRKPTQFGLEASETVQHILRLMESASSPYQDTVHGIWHHDGLVFKKKNQATDDSTSSSWIADKPSVENGGSSFQPRNNCLLSINLSDDRTVLVRVQSSTTGMQSFYSILRLDDHRSDASYYNGWKILRQVCQVEDDVLGGNLDSSTSATTLDTSYAEVENVLQKYLSIEHGGGQEDSDLARSLFAKDATLLSVGIDPPPEDGMSVQSPWSAVVGDLVEIPLQTYIDGVHGQTPHNATARKYDSILSIDMLPCKSVAAATVLVGNGACTNLFCDHLLLGKSGDSDGGNIWKILSKTFSVRKWPKN